MANKSSPNQNSPLPLPPVESVSNLYLFILFTRSRHPADAPFGAGKMPALHGVDKMLVLRWGRQLNLEAIFIGHYFVSEALYE